MRAIDADSLIRLVMDSTILDDGFKSVFVALVEGEPTIQPDIIHCKDCDWWAGQEDSTRARCILCKMYPTGGWYCGNARWREVTR